MILSANEQSFRQDVLESDRLVLTNFWAPWCGLCRLLNPMLTKLDAEWGDHLKIVHINADESLKLATAYRLTTLPTLLVFDAGEVIYRLDAFKSPDDVRAAIDQLITKKNLFSAFAAQKIGV